MNEIKAEICRAQNTVCGCIYEYSLKEARGTDDVPGYYIYSSVWFNGSRDEKSAFVGHDRERAIAIFKTVSCNAVSPCALSDVLSDIETADLLL